MKRNDSLFYAFRSSGKCEFFVLKQGDTLLLDPDRNINRYLLKIKEISMDDEMADR